MAGNNRINAQRERSPSLEITNKMPHAAGDTRATFQSQGQTTSHPSNSSPTTPSTHIDRGAAVRNFFRGNGPRDPPLTTVQMNDVTVAKRDLTLLYGAAELPPMDYPGSFASSSAASLPRSVHDHMENLRQRDRMQAAPPRPPERQTVRSASAPDLAQALAAAQGVRRRQHTTAVTISGTTPPTPTTAAPAPTPTIAPLDLGMTTPGPASTTPASAAPTTNPQAGTAHPQLGTAALPGESERDKIYRHHDIDIDSGIVYRDGTASIPQNVQALVAAIKAIRKSGQGFPIRVDLKKLEDFTNSKGTLRYTSPLWAWYGDTRLSDRRTWYYLVTEGRGTQIP